MGAFAVTYCCASDELFMLDRRTVEEKRKAIEEEKSELEMLRARVKELEQEVETLRNPPIQVTWTNLPGQNDITTLYGSNSRPYNTPITYTTTTDNTAFSGYAQSEVLTGEIWVESEALFNGTDDATGS